MENLWNLTLLNSIRDKKDFKRNRIYLITKKKRLSIMTIRKLDILNKIADNNNISHNNVFRELYR